MNTDRREWFTRKLKDKLAAAGIHRRDMAIRLRLKPSTFYAYLEARAEPNVVTLKNFCKIIGETVDEFLSDCPESEKV